MLTPFSVVSKAMYKTSNARIWVNACRYHNDKRESRKAACCTCCKVILSTALYKHTNRNFLLVKPFIMSYWFVLALRVEFNDFPSFWIAGKRRRRAFINQLLIWCIVNPVCAISICFSSSVGYGWCTWSLSQLRNKSVTCFGRFPRRRFPPVRFWSYWSMPISTGVTLVENGVLWSIIGRDW